MRSMYGLSPETDLSPLTGSMLTFVGLGQYVDLFAALLA